MHSKNPTTLKVSNKILNEFLDINKLKKISLTKKTVSTIEKITKAYASHHLFVDGVTKLTDKSKVLSISKKLSYFRNFETGKVVFKFLSLEKITEQIKGKDLIFEIDGKKVTLQQFKKHAHFEYENVSKSTAKKLIEKGYLEIDVKAGIPKKFRAEAEKLLKSNALAKVVVAIEAYVWASATKKLTNEYTVKNVAGFSVASIKLSAATMSLIEKMKLYDKHLLKKGFNKTITASKIDRFKINVSVLKVVSSSITLFTAGRDAYNHFSVRDNDTATLYAMAAGISSVFLAADISALIVSGTTAFSLGFWPAALLGGALIGCYYLAQKYFADTQLEAYFKNFPLSDYALPVQPNERPHEYINRLISNSKQTVIDPWFETAKAKEYKSYNNFEKAFIAFLDLVTPTLALLELAPNGYNTGNKGFDKDNVSSNHFKAKIYSAQTIQHHDDLDIQAWFYPYGIKAPLKEEHRFEITTFLYPEVTPSKTYSTEEEILPNCIVEFGLPKQFYWKYNEYPHGEILFLYRVRVQNEEFTPTNFNNQKRYAFAFTKITHKKDYSSKYMTNIFTVHKYGQKTGVRNLKLNSVPASKAQQKFRIVAENDIKNLASYNPKLEK